MTKTFTRIAEDLMIEWHPSKNGTVKPGNVSAGSGKRYWWKCSKGNDHEWEASVANRTQGRGCPICSGHKVVKSNCLATTNPDLAKECHPTKNGNLLPEHLLPKSNKKIWWKCGRCKHEWKAFVYQRSSGTGCPNCRCRGA